MNKPILFSRMIMTALAVGLVVSGYLWLNERSRSEQALNELAIARTEVDRLAKEIIRKPADQEKLPLPQTASQAPLTAFPTEPSTMSIGSDALQVTAVAVTNTSSPPPLSAEAISAIERFDLAMDREFERLDTREAGSADQAEVTTIQKIKDKLTALDDLYRRADVATNPEDQMAIRQEMQKIMGDIIGLSRVDRNERLGSLATQIGYHDPEAVEAFIREVDRIYRETHMDWTKLFNRGPPPATGTPSPGPGAPPITPTPDT